ELWTWRTARACLCARRLTEELHPRRILLSTVSSARVLPRGGGPAGAKTEPLGGDCLSPDRETREPGELRPNCGHENVKLEMNKTSVDGDHRARQVSFSVVQRSIRSRRT